VPATVWALTRALALVSALDPSAPRPSAPKLLRRAPNADELNFDGLVTDEA
jgi:hypothetical protein